MPLQQDTHELTETCQNSSIELGEPLKKIKESSSFIHTKHKDPNIILTEPTSAIHDDASSNNTTHYDNQEKKEIEPSSLNGKQPADNNIDSPTSLPKQSATLHSTQELVANDDDVNVSVELMNKTRKEKFIFYIKLLFAHLLGVLKLCWPTVVMNVCNVTLGLESLSFIGHIKVEDETMSAEEKGKMSELHMAAASLGNSFLFCFIYIAVGLTHGQDTLVSQAVGANNLKRAGQILARSITTIILALIPISVILCVVNYSLILMNQEDNLVHLVGLYLRILVPGVLPFTLCEALSLFLVSQHILLPNVIIWLSSIFLNFGLTYVFVFGVGFKGLGFIGAPIATTITRYFMLTCYISVIYFKGYMKNTWHGFVDVRNVFQWAGFKEFLKLALPGALMLTFEIWGFEISTITSSFVSQTALAAHSVVLQISALTYMVPLSQAAATSIRIGQLLGARQPMRAKYTAYSSMMFAGLIMFLSGSTLALARDYIPMIYTEDPEIISMSASVFPLCAIFQLFDGVQVIGGAVIRGIGKQVIGAAISIVLALYIIFRLNWRKESETAFERATKHTMTTNESTSISTNEDHVETKMSIDLEMNPVNLDVAAAQQHSPIQLFVQSGQENTSSNKTSPTIVEDDQARDDLVATCLKLSTSVDEEEEPIEKKAARRLEKYHSRLKLLSESVDSLEEE
nr:unnamed protein product [Naegleria fowleri]